MSYCRKAGGSAEGRSKFFCAAEGGSQRQAGCTMERRPYPSAPIPLVLMLGYVPQVKRNISRDPRYDAVGSSSLREELFNTFLKANGAMIGSASPSQEKESGEAAEMTIEDDEEERERKRKEKKERAVKERETQVKAERSRVEADIGRSRMGLTKEEGESQFRCGIPIPVLKVGTLRSCATSMIFRTMLTDAIRDPLVRL